MGNKENEEITVKQIWGGILLVVLLVGGYFLADIILSRLNRNTTPTEINTPNQEEVATSTIITPTSTTEVHSLNLIEKPYTPPEDIYANKESYNKNAVQLVLKGKFSEAKIIVKGTTQNDLLNFISLSVDEISGTIGASRKNSSTLDLENSPIYFTKSAPLDLTIDLKKPFRMSTTKNEFLSTFKTYKDPVIWDNIAPPPLKGTLTKIVIAPYSSAGQYGDHSIINELKFQYACESESDCAAMLCPKKNYTYGSECVKEVFGIESAQSYADFFK